MNQSLQLMEMLGEVSNRGLKVLKAKDMMAKSFVKKMAADSRMKDIAFDSKLSQGNPEPTVAQLNDPNFSNMSKAGAEVFRQRLNGWLGKDVGANIADQSTSPLSMDDLKGILKVLRKEMNR